MKSMSTNPLRWAFRRVENALTRRGYRITWAPPMFATPDAELRFGLEFIIAHLMLTWHSIFFVQIGANDGISNDPLYKFITQFGWEGILLEPLPDVFETLQATYRDYPRLLLLNAALADKDGSRPIYTVRMDDSVHFQKAHQLSSFRRESLAGQIDLIPDIADRIEERQVRCLSFDTILNEAQGRTVDLLQIDTEGYDYTILKMIDFSQLRPAIICYEHVHMSKAQQEESAALLFKEGYHLTRDNLDTVGYRPERRFGFR
jgi:FkbM family methyltransferase